MTDPNRLQSTPQPTEARFENGMTGHDQPDNVGTLFARQKFTVSLFSLIALLYFIVFSFIVLRGAQNHPLLYIHIFGLASVGIILILSRFNRTINLASHLLAFLGVCILTSYVLNGGIDQTGIIWLPVFAPWAYYLTGRRSGTLWVLFLSLTSITGAASDVISYTSAAYPLPVVVVAVLSLLFASAFVYASEYRREQTEKDLFDSEQKFRVLVDNAWDGVSIHNTDLSLRYVSPAISKLLGYSAEAIRRLRPVDIVHPEDAQTLLDSVETVLKLPDSKHLTICRFRHQDGGWRWFELTITNRLHNRAIQGLVFNFRDLTDLRRLEGALLLAESKFKLIYEKAPIGISILNKDRLLLDANPTLEKIIGLPKKQLLQGDFHGLRFIREDGVEMPPAEFASTRALVEGKHIQNIITGIVTEVGRTLWTEVSALPLNALKEEVVVITQDITPRKQAEDALRESERRYRNLVESSPDGIFVNYDGRIVFANPAFADLLGAQTAEQILGIPPFDVIHPSYHAEVQELVAMLLERGGHLGRREWIFVRLNGGFVPVEVTVSVISYGAGKALQVIARDITAHKQAEQALRASEERFSTFFQKGAFVASLARWPDGVLVDVNEGFEEAFGYTKEEAIGRTTLELGINPDVDSRARIIVALQEHGSIRNLELPLHTRSGALRIFAINVDRVNIGDQQYILNISQDITEHKKAEAQVHYQAYLLANVNDAIIATDDQFVITAWNKGAERMYGWTAEEAIGQVERTLLKTERVGNTIEDAIATAQRIGEIYTEVIHTHKDGEKILVEAHATVLRDANNQLLGYVSTNLNVTARKQAEAALRASEARFHITLDTMPEGCQIIDFDWRYIYLNDAAAGQSRRRREDLLGRTMMEVYPGIETTELFAVLRDCMENRIAHEMENHFVYPDGTSGWFMLSMKPSLEGIFIVSRDITARKQAEKAARENAERQRIFAELASDFVFEVSFTENGKPEIKWLSDSFEHITGYSKAEIEDLGGAVSYAHPDDLLIYQADFARVMQGETVISEARAITKRGTVIWLRNYSRPIWDVHLNRVVRVYGAGQNITARKQSEMELAALTMELEQRVADRTAELDATNQYLRSLASTTLVINSSLEPNEVLDHILTQARGLIPCRAMNIMLIRGESAYIARRIGYEGLEQIERDLQGYQFPLSWPSFSQMLARGLSVHIADTLYEPSWQHAESTEWVRSYIGVPLRVGERTLGFLNASHNEPDFFSRQDAAMLEGLAEQAAIAIENARLLDQVKAMLEREQALRNQLVQTDKLAALGTMVAVIAHEINNPIQTVKNSLFLLKDRLELQGPLREAFDFAQVEVNRIVELVAQLRDTYRPRSTAITQILMVELLAEIHSFLAPQLRKNRVEWVVVSPARQYVVVANHNNIKQVFLNLCLNAIEAMEPLGGGTLRLSLHGSMDDRQVGVAIHDTGPIIPAENLPRIFEPFFTTKSSGTGLGLAISYDIIRQYGGEIEVKNGTDQGVTFTIWLPQAAEGKEAEHENDLSGG